ncbi:MAG: SMP-30/gluconolactonase/LRE family protein [Planctomycetota bacterium]
MRRQCLEFCVAGVESSSPRNRLSAGELSAFLEPSNHTNGLTIDTHGNLYITSGLGIQVYDPHGKLLGILSFPKQPANCTFGGPGNHTLFVTARTSLYAVEMEAEGHVFPGKAE